MAFSLLPCLVFTIFQHFKIGTFHTRVQILGGLDLLVVLFGPETLWCAFSLNNHGAQENRPLRGTRT